MSASDHVSQAQTGKYQFHRTEEWAETHYHIYKGNSRVGRMEISHLDDDGDYYDEIDRPHKVAFLQTAHGHQLAGMTALGIAANVAQDEGRKLTPDTSLSTHSSKLVRNAQRRGLVTEDRSNAQTNEVTFNAPTPVDYKYGHRLNTEEVNAGRKTIRAMARRQK